MATYCNSLFILLQNVEIVSKFPEGYGASLAGAAPVAEPG